MDAQAQRLLQAMAAFNVGRPGSEQYRGPRAGPRNCPGCRSR